jgi:murein DD-endopeptidase / murein LD-carboxypeptidase
MLCPLLLLSQTKKKKSRHLNAKKQGVHEYFALNQLCPDSACTPFLYYQVYEWAGTRYRYGGHAKSGIDCSGFVSQMYESSYCIHLSGGSKDIWQTVMPVEKINLQEGDIVFFKIKKGQISHVGIYLGNNKFAHASVKQGVIVSDLDEAYYKKYFFKGGRVIGQ